MNLSEVKTGQSGRVCGVSGSARFLSRVTSVGITEGCRFTVMQNRLNRPVLLHARDSAIALDRHDCERILVEVKR